VAENVIGRLFELEPAVNCDCELIALPDGWQELVSEAGFCDFCGEVVRPQSCRSTHPTIYATAMPR
jgi:hypothetical protein